MYSQIFVPSLLLRTKLVDLSMFPRVVNATLSCDFSMQYNFVPRNVLSFFSSIFSFFKEKLHCAASDEEQSRSRARGSEAKEKKKKEETSRKETICGEAVASGVQTPASPISRLVVKHWALGRFRGAARLCRCFRSRRGARLRAFYTRLRAYDEKGDHLFCSIETTSNRQQEREIGS